jgi:ElaB/YqjD/DUF883 family membrane-anchored ribosome-binding protein
VEIDMTDVTVDKLMEDLKAVAADAEALLAATAHDASERVRAARQRASESLGKARTRLGELEEQVKDRATAAAHELDHYVHANPWPAIAAAAGIGALIGILLSRR